MVKLMENGHIEFDEKLTPRSWKMGNFGILMLS